MADRRVYVPHENWSAESLLVRGTEAHHLKNVLRAHPGDSFEFIDGKGRWARAVITQIVSQGEMECRILEQTQTTSPDENHFVLLQALIRFEKWEWILEKAVELSVTKVVPLVTVHTEAKWREITASRWKRWQRILTEATKQCRRLHIPLLARPTQFDEAVSQVHGDVKLMLSEKPGTPPLRGRARESLPGQVRPDDRPGERRLAVAIGPEGGWAEEEIVFAENYQFLPVSLGETILRSETAAIAALAIARYEFLD